MKLSGQSGKIPRYKTSRKSSPVGAELFHGVLTDMGKLIAS
jgi:hypothetical protein